MQWKQYICLSSTVLKKQIMGQVYFYFSLSPPLSILCTVMVKKEPHSSPPPSDHSGEMRLLWQEFFFHYCLLIGSSLYITYRSLILDTHHCWDHLIQSKIKAPATLLPFSTKKINMAVIFFHFRKEKHARLEK